MPSLSSYIFKVANTTLHTSLTYKRSQKKLLPEEICNKKYLVSQLDRDSKLLDKKCEISFKHNRFSLCFEHIIHT